jgi:hypothetical protein
MKERNLMHRKISLLWHCPFKILNGVEYICNAKLFIYHMYNILYLGIDLPRQI